MNALVQLNCTLKNVQSKFYVTCILPQKKWGENEEENGKKISIQYYLCRREAHLGKKKKGSPYL